MVRFFCVGELANKRRNNRYIQVLLPQFPLHSHFCSFSVALEKELLLLFVKVEQVILQHQVDWSAELNEYIITI
jgi:hypothetical protein